MTMPYQQDRKQSRLVPFFGSGERSGIQRSDHVVRYTVIGLVSVGIAAIWSVKGFESKPLLTSFYLVVLVYLAATDLRARSIPNRVSLPATVIAVLSYPWGPYGQEVELLQSFSQSFFGWFFCALWMTLAAWLSAGKLAWGDVKLAGLVGAVIGMPFAPAALAAGILMGGTYALLAVGSGFRKKYEYMPYGVAIAGGGCALVIYSAITLSV